MSNRLNSIIFGQRRPYSAHAEKFCDGTHTHICRFIYFRNIDALKVHLCFGFGLLRGVFFGVARDRAIAASREKVIGEDYAYLKFIYTMYMYTILCKIAVAVAITRLWLWDVALLLRLRKNLLFPIGIVSSRASSLGNVFEWSISPKIHASRFIIIRKNRNVKLNGSECFV